MSSVLNSVFKGRKGKKNRFPLVRAQSPPSPGSFVSPDPSDRPFNPYSAFGASQASLSQASRVADDLPPDANRRVSSPKVNVDIGTGFSFSEFFASETFQQKGDTPVPRPERNVSLGVTTGGSTGSVGRGAEYAAHHRDASGSGQSHAGSLSNGSIRRLPIPPRISEESQLQDGHVREQSFSEDEIIVIEAPRGRDPTQSPLGSSFKTSISPETASEHETISSHRPAPAPLQIPDTGFQRRRAASLESSHPDKHPDRSVSPSSRLPSRTRSRSRLRSRSRPASTYSRYSDTDIDYDDNLSSAVSGTTLARALVSSYILSPSSSFTTPSPSGQTYARQRGHLARQDSATLPRGELPFTFNRKSLRSSKGSLAPSSRVPSTYWRDRRISGDQIVVMSPEERGGWGDGDVPPVPPVPVGLTPESSPHVDSRRPSPSRSDTGSSGGLTAEWRYSNGARRAFTDVVLDSVPDKKRRRISKISEASGSQAAPSIYPAYGSRSHDSLVSDVSDGDEPPRRSHEPSLKDVSDVRSVKRGSQHEGQLSDALPTAESGTSSQDTPGYDTPALSQTQSATSAESPVQTPASAAVAVSHLRTRMSRSYSESSPRRSMGPRPVTLLPIGERPRSQLLTSQLVNHPRTSSESMVRPLSLTSPLQPPVMLAASGDSPDSPDLLDIMLAGSRVVQRSNGSSSTRVISPPAPISVPPPTSPEYGFLQEDPNSPSTASAVRQTFPETPYAFTPLVSAGFASPQLPQGAPPPSRSTTTRGKPQRPGMQKRALMRHATMMSPPTTADFSGAMPMTPPLTGADSALVSADEFVLGGANGSTTGALPMIEEGMSPISPMSQPSSYTNTPEHSPAPPVRSRPVSKLSVEHSSDRPASLVPAKRSLTPLPSPPPTSVPLPLSRSPSPVPSEPGPPKEEIAEEKAAEEPVEAAVVEASLPVHDQHSDEQTQDRTALPFPAPPPVAFSRSETPDTTQRSRPQPLPLPPVIVKRASNNSRGARSRPPPPSGPRKPSGSMTLLSRSRNGSVSSSLNSPPSSTVGSNLTHSFAKGSMSLSSASSPRFQTQPVKFRGMTMEAAQWTWSRQQLQETVSAAIKKSSNPSSIRLLPSEALNGEVPVEIERLEALSGELRTNYKLAVRKRRMLLDSLRSIADGGELADQSASARLLDDLVELSEQIDHYAEELYIVTDQLSQLRRLQDQHHGSALAMGLHKLNNAIVKHLAEKETLRQRLAEVEAHADDAWKKAEEAARELDELSDKMAMSEGIITPASSRRSSKVSIARKASVRKAGLRSPSRLRSQRSSVASRSSMIMSPPMRTASFEDVPPVPPIPVRAPLALSTADLPSRSSGMTSEGTPLSEIRAMLQAQEELCAMLGISPEDLRVPAIETRPKRSMSLSAALGTPHSPRSFLPRTVSESYTPSTSASESFRFHRRSRTIDDRTAVLATIGMVPA